MRRPFPAGDCLPPTTWLTKNERGPISAKRSRYLKYAPKPKDSRGQNHPFSATCRRPTVNRGRGGATHFLAPRKRGGPFRRSWSSRGSREGACLSSRSSPSANNSVSASMPRCGTQDDENGAGLSYREYVLRIRSRPFETLVP